MTLHPIDGTVLETDSGGVGSLVMGLRRGRTRTVVEYVGYGSMTTHPDYRKQVSSPASPTFKQNV